MGLAWERVQRYIFCCKMALRDLLLTVQYHDEVGDRRNRNYMILTLMYVELGPKLRTTAILRHLICLMEGVGVLSVVIVIVLAFLWQDIRLGVNRPENSY